jgi:peptide/nickel transport system permease protein
MTDLLRLLNRRLLVGLPSLLGAVVVVFFLIRLSGESPVPFLAGPNATKAEIDALTAQLGLDRPLFEQLWIYLGRLAQGDLGQSWLSSRPVLAELLDRLPATLELVLLATLLGAAVGVTLGAQAAFRAGGAFDNLVQTAATIVFSVPIYVVGLVSIFVFFYLLNIAPPPLGRLSLVVLPPPAVTGSYALDALISGNGEALASALAQLTLPVACFSLIVAGPILVQTRAIVGTALGSEYVDYARASGLPRKVVRRIALRNSLVPIVTLLGSELAHLFAASSLIELVFAWGGIGHWGLNAILQGDFAAVQGYVLALALFSLLVFLVVDLVVFALEPRSRIA